MPQRAAGRLLGEHLAPLQGEGGPQVALGRAGEEFHPGHRSNGRQCLSPKPQGADGRQVLGGAQLAGGVAEKGGLALVGGNAAAVVGHPDHGHAPPLNLHCQGMGAGVHGVFHQFLHHRSRPLHHLAGRNEVGHVGVQHLNLVGHENTTLSKKKSFPQGNPRGNLDCVVIILGKRSPPRLAGGAAFRAFP